MDHSFLLTADPPSLAQYLQACATRSSIKEVTNDLLARIDNESLPSRIYVCWLSAGGDCEAICQGIRFQNSKTVRKASIVHFGRLFRTIRISDVWSAIGGTAGIIDFLASASVYDVKSFCRQIGRSATSKMSATSRMAFVDELYQELCHMTTSGAERKTASQRPLEPLYNAIFPACSPNLILSVVDDKSGMGDVGNGESAFFARTTLFRSRCISELRDPEIKVDLQKLRALLKVSSNDGSSHHDTSLTANTQFALEALEILSMRAELNGYADGILTDIAGPLFRRMVRRNCRPETLVRATLVYGTFIQQHLSKRLTFNDMLSGPVRCFIKYWGRYPDRLEDLLVSLLRLAPRSHLLNATECVKLVRLVPNSLRIRLLGVLSRNDLQTGHGLKQAEIQWDSQLLLALPPAEARRILQRLMEMGSEKLCKSSPPDYRQGDISLLAVKLSRSEPNAIQLATAAVEEQKKEASQAREQSQRAVKVSTALKIAATSQCLDLYRQVLLWTRKYIKDSLTSMEVFQEKYIASNDSLGLLCGIPEEQHECAVLTKDKIASNVRLANIIIMECFQTTCKAQQEPGFKANHWNSVLGLMGAVVCKRYERANALQDALRLSDDDVFDIVWHDTLETCIALEASGLHDDNMGLNFNTLGGPLMKSNTVLPMLIDPRPATFRFLDTMARVRDESWKNHRRKHVPATMTIPEPYPRGLPLDCLVPVDLKQCEVGSQLPYLFSRAERIIFLPVDVALAPQPVSEDDNKAIGAFVENWQSALTNFLYMSGDPHTAALTAWKHVTGELSNARMSDTEAHLFWQRIFSDSLEDTDLHGPWEEAPAEPLPPQIPHMEDEQPIEWTLETNVKPFEVKSRRRLEPVRIDAMLNAYSRVDKTIHSETFTDTYSEVPRHRLDSFWHRWMDRRTAAPAVREALVAASMLHISEINLVSPGILSMPFPSGQYARFPALFLDGDFLDQADAKHTQGFLWGTMKRRSTEFPATLLLWLIKSLIKEATASKDQTLTPALKLLRILIKGDRPQVACDLIQELILDRPEDSSWQRLILTKGFINSLSKQTVERFLWSLSAAIQKALSENTGSSDGDSPGKAPRIKITTVKLLSQLLSGANFIDDYLASSFLIGILAKAKHIDVRVSVLESLLEVLKKPRDTVLCNNVLAAFETYLIPVMSGINERAPMSRDEWMACDSYHLPELYGLRSGSLPPLLSCMISAVPAINESMRKQLFDQILLPTLWRSCDTNGRWTRLFAESQGSMVLATSPPKTPMQLQFLIELMRWPAYISSSAVDLWLQILTVVLQPPSEIVAMNKGILEDPEVLSSSNGQHWLALWGPNAQKLLTHRSKPASMLSKDWQTTREDGLTIGYIQNVVLRQFDLTLPFYTPPAYNDYSWKSFIADFQPLAWSSKNLGIWHRNVKPLLQHILNKVEALHTVEWQRNPSRSPSALPDTFLWRLWLLTPPLGSECSRDDDLKTFADSVGNLLVELNDSHRSYIKKYEAIASFIREQGTTTDWATLALRFGDLDGMDCEGLNTVDDLKIDLCRQLLEATRDAPPPREAQRTKVRIMVRNLANCVDENVREIGMKLHRNREHSSVKFWYNEDVES